MSDDLAAVAEDLAKGGLFLVSGSLIATVISAIASIIIARILGPELYGQYVLALVVPSMLFLVTGFGINQGLTRFAASLRAKGELAQVARIIKHGILIKAIIGFTIFLVNFTLADFLASTILNRPELGFYIQVASVSITFQVIFTTAASAFIGLDKAEYSAMSTNIQAISKTIIAIALVLAGFGVLGAISGYVIGYVAGSAVALTILLPMINKFTNHDEDRVPFMTTVSMLMKYGLPLYAAALLVGFILPYQNLVLGLFTTDVEVGYFKAASNFISLITLVSMPITSMLLPAFSKLTSTMEERMRTFFLFANKYTTLLVVPIATLIAVFSTEIVQIIYGSTYEAAGIYLSLYCLLYFLTGIGYLTLSSFFNGLGETKLTMKTNLVTFTILVPLSPILANTYGVTGLIAASLTAQTAGALYAMSVAKKRFSLTFATLTLIRIYVAAALSAPIPFMLLQFSPLPSLFNVIAGGLLYLYIYITISPILGTVNKPELQSLSEITQKQRMLRLIFKPLLRYQEKILSIRNPDNTEM